MKRESTHGRPGSWSAGRPHPSGTVPPVMRVLLLCTAALAGLTGCLAEDEALPAAVGTEAPAYRAATLDGDTVALASYRGEVALLNVWATWCAPCRFEIPELVALQDEHGDDGLRIVGVSVDTRGSRDAILRFVDEFGMDYDLLWDPHERVSTVFRAHGVPASVLIDRNGIIRWRQVGPFRREDERLQQALRAALAER